MCFLVNRSTMLIRTRLSNIAVLQQVQQPTMSRLFSWTSPQFWKSARRWTQDELDTLERLTEEGKSDEEIGEALSRSTSSIIQRRIRWRSGEGLTVGRKERSWTQQDDEKLCSLRDQGRGWREIASVFDSTYQGVQTRWRRLHGLDRNTFADQVKTTPWSSLEVEQLMSMSEAKFTVIQIATELNRPYRHVLYRLKTMNRQRKVAAYTKDEDEQIIRLKREGKGWKEIQLSMPWRTIVSLRLRYCRRSEGSFANARKAWSKEEDAKLHGLLEEGSSPGDIGFRLGRTAVAIRGRMQVLKVSISRARRRKEQK